MLAIRLAKRRHEPLDTTGARLLDGRWHTRPRSVVYASECLGGALLEILARTTLGKLPGPHHAVRLEIPDDVAIERLEPEDLPGWDDVDRKTSQRFGNAWFDEVRTVGLVVPAVPTRPLGRNILLNPAHEDFRRFVAGEPVDVGWDRRLFFRGP